MAKLKKYDLSGKELGEVSIAEELTKVSANSQMIKDYLVAIRKNARQWSANTQTRAEVSKTGKKPFQQKGLGRARQGSFAAPQFKGGGRVFGPRPKFDQHVRINKKERRLAMASLFLDQVKEGHVSVLDCKSLKEPKTKLVSKFLEKMECKGKRVLFLGEEQKKNDNSLLLSVRNLEKTQYVTSGNINGYLLAQAANIVILDSAFEEIVQKLLKQGK